MSDLCDRCSSPPAYTSQPRWGGCAEAGEVRSAKFTSICVPLLGLVQDACNSICTRNSALRGAGKPSRPCVVLNAREGAQAVCLLCTFQGSTPPEVFLPFVVPVSTLGKASPNELHVHSNPEWAHKNAYQQWILAIPFRPFEEDLEELDGFTSAALPNGVYFDEDALVKLRGVAKRVASQWRELGETNATLRRDVEKYILEWEAKTVARSRRSKCTNKTGPSSAGVASNNGRSVASTSCNSTYNRNWPRSSGTQQTAGGSHLGVAHPTQPGTVPARSISKFRRTLGAISDNFSLYSNSSARSARSKHALKIPPALGAGTGARTNAFSVLAMDTVQE